MRGSGQSGDRLLDARLLSAAPRRLERVAEGVELTIEAGAGKVLSVMNRRTVRALEGLTMGTPEDISAVAERLNG